MDTRETIREYVVNNFIKGRGLKTLLDDDSFLEEGAIDSVGVLELIAFLEETFSVRVEDEEIVPENFDSVNQLVNFVHSKLANSKS